MRPVLAAPVLALLTLAAAAPALSQPINTRERLGEMEARAAAQNQLDRQQGVAQQNQLNALDARLRTEQAVSNVRPNLPRPVPQSYTAGTPAPVQGTPAAGAAGFADIPDGLLQQSNQAVRDAADNRR